MKKPFHDLPEPVAIIGAACRFPGRASSLSSFWKVLESGTDVISTVPEGRFCRERYLSVDKNLAGHSYTLAAGVIEHLKDFDCDFFGISRKEAQDMDPQQRLALESAWEALEEARILPSSLRGSRTGVYMGASNMDNSLQAPDDPSIMSPYSMTGANLSIIANRISHFFDLRGPSMTVDTACSSSLVAVHLACEAIRSGEVSLAIAGGVNILLAPYGFIGFSKARMLSPEGRCKVFDAAGNGYVRSEGAGSIILKPLSLALKDKNNILAVIAGSGVNSDGRTTGIALPNEKSQTELLSQVYSRFALDKNKVVYVEAHGTGTAAGDPVEASSIGTVLGRHLKSTRPLSVGSVKGNIGHLEAASGMAGIIKAILVLRHGKIPPNLHFNTPNPAIDFAGLNIRVPQKLMPLPRAGGNELISVNSFGFGGANAHVVLQRPGRKAAQRLSSERGNPLPPFFLSAASAPSLQKLSGEYAALLDKRLPDHCYDVAASLAFGREPLPFRRIIQADTPETLCAKLRGFAENGSASPLSPAAGCRAHTCQGLFVFSGNGSQWCGMGQRLARTDRIFRETLEELDAMLSVFQDWSVMDCIRNPKAHTDTFSFAEKSQPLLFAVQVALVKALEAKGLKPSGVMGHSVGEVAGAWACGSLSLKDAVTVIYYRSMLQARMRGHGAMAAVNIAAEDANELLHDFGGGIEISAINSPSSITLSSYDAELLRDCVARCKKLRIAAKMLELPYPYHTKAMEGIKDELIAALSDIAPRKPVLPFYSTVSGSKLASPPGARYWYENLRRPVLFAKAAGVAFADGFRHFLEVGPSPVLRTYLRDIYQDNTGQVSILPTLFNNDHEDEDFDAAWKQAWQSGWNLDRKKHFPLPFSRRELPSYPWNREFLWPEDSPDNRGFLKAERLHPLLGWALPGNPSIFENVLDTADFPWLKDHVVGNGVVYPAAAFLESMLAAGALLHPASQVELERVAILRPLPLEEGTAKDIRLLVDKEDGGFKIEARRHTHAEEWGGYAKGRIVSVAESPADPGLSFASPDSFGMAISTDTLYRSDRHFLLRYGPAFRTVEKAWIRPDAQFPEILCEFGEPEYGSAQGMHMPPTLIDGAMQSLFILLGAQNKKENRTYLPVSFERVVLFASGVPRFAHTRLERVSARSVVASFRLLDESGNTLLLLKQCRLRRAYWLEHEHTDSKPYATELTPLPHPGKVSPVEGISTHELARQAEQDIQKAQASAGSEGGLGVHPYLLLQLTALSSAHESVLSLCGSPARGLQCGSRELVESGLLDPRQELWFNAMLERLEDGELAQRANDRWHVQPRGDRVKAEILWRTVLSASPRYQPEVTLLAHVFRRHGLIMSGAYADKESGALAPRLMQNYFSNSSVLQPSRLAAVRCVESVLRAGKSGQLVNILHLAETPEDLLPDILPLLEGRPCRYVVAEKDEASAQNHALQAGEAPSLFFRCLDPEAPPPEEHGNYHLILMVWSLHSHLNSAKTLESCFSMLAPGGVLCVLEHSPSVFTDYVFGSAPAWWAASPDQDAPVSLLQGPDYWEDMLAKAGFTHCSVTGRQDDAYRPSFLLFGQKPYVLEESTTNALQETASPAQTTATGSASDWLIVTGKKGSQGAKLGLSLEKHLRAHGENARLLAYRNADKAGDGSWWRETLAAHKPDKDSGPIRLVFLAGYDNGQENTPEVQLSLQADACLALAELARAWDALRIPVQLWVVCGGALADGMPDARPVPSQGGIAGFTRVFGNELRSLACRLVDLHGDLDAALEMLPGLVTELLQPTDESEVAFCRNNRYVPRLSRLVSGGKNSRDPEKTAAALRFDIPGRLQNLYWAEVPRPEPKADEVCIEVKHTGLNFRDVMWSMGMLPDEALENGFSGPGMGIECSGIVCAVGKNVRTWKAGDEVICFCPDGFSSHVLTSTSAIARKPQNMSFAEGATIPVAFITAWYSLTHLARMQAGESVLIHGAAGGVGMAAIQIAAHLGLKVYATAGSPEKHDFLRQLGVSQLYSSRTLAFAEQIMDHTGGKGVDAVLNSLAGEAIPAGLSVLRPFGRFLELGKRDFFADSPMRLKPFSNNISYFGIDVDQLLVHQPALAQKLFTELMELFEQRKLVPLPHTVYPVTRTVDAFQAMQQSGHIGKLVVSAEGALSIARQAAPEPAKLQLKADASYLVTGGTSGLGLASAVRLARRGAKHLLLLSRKGFASKEDRQIADTLRANGATVIEVKADVADREQLFSALRKHLKQLPPLRGVIHAAAILDDSLITGLDAKALRRSFDAKCLGAFNLHLFTRENPVDFFVLYSSTSAPFGNPGQAAYVAANSMLESLGALRRSQGLPAQVIGWGPIADTGMMARNPANREKLQKVLGISSTACHDALYWLEHCIAANVGDSYYFGLDWHNRSDLPTLDSPRYSRLRPKVSAMRASDGPSADHIRSLGAKEGAELLTAMLVEEISHVLRLPRERLGPDTPLVSQGMDSLMAVELAMALEQKFDLKGYSLSLTENSTARSVAASLHAYIAGTAQDDGRKEQDEERMVQSLEQKHGFRLSEQKRDAVLQRMKEEPHGQ